MMRRKSDHPSPTEKATDIDLDVDLLFQEEEELSPRTLMARLTRQTERRIDAAFGKNASLPTQPTLRTD
jgi:hypothetical protein